MPAASTVENPPRYFPGLNALRFYAAFSVLIMHTAVNFAELRTNAAIIPGLEYLLLDAQTAVTLFFVLSGFLIAARLLEERSQSQTISVRRFYLRRILRIWPLYYLTAAIGFFLLPLLIGESLASLRSIFLVAVFLPNLVGPLGPLDHLWTIGLEEQFYLVMPWLVKKDRLVLACNIVILIKLGLEPIVLAFNHDAILNLFHAMRFEAMAVGALSAWVYHYRHWTLRLIYHPLTQLAAGVFCVVLAIFDVRVSSVSTLALSLTFMIVIVNAATNPGSPLCIESRFTTYWGMRSYGFYMAHYPILYLALWELRAAGIPEGPLFTVILYVIVITATMIVSVFSYRWFEAPLLRLKARFAAVQS